MIGDWIPEMKAFTNEFSPQMWHEARYISETVNAFLLGLTGSTDLDQFSYLPPPLIKMAMTRLDIQMRRLLTFNGREDLVPFWAEIHGRYDVILPSVSYDPPAKPKRRGCGGGKS